MVKITEPLIPLLRLSDDALVGGEMRSDRFGLTCPRVVPSARGLQGLGLVGSAEPDKRRSGFALRLLPV